MEVNNNYNIGDKFSYRNFYNVPKHIIITGILIRKYEWVYEVEEVDSDEVFYFYEQDLDTMHYEN